MMYMYIYVSVNQTIFGSDNGLSVVSPVWRQAITNDELLSIGTWEINLSEIFSKDA